MVIAYYDTPEATTQLVDRLAAEIDGGLRAEVLVVDDASPRPFPAHRVARCLRHGTNRGFGSAVNTGAVAASAPALVVVNSDLVPGEHFLRDLLDDARAHPGDLVSADVRTPLRDGSGAVTDTNDPLLLQAFPTPWAVARSKLAVVNCSRRGPAPPAVRVAEGWIGGTAFCVDTEVFRSVGGFDPDFFMYVEDVDLCWRLRERGVRTVLGSVAVDHLGGVSSSSEAKRAWANDSMFVYARKRRFLVRFVLAWLAMTVLNLGYDLARLVTGRRVAALRTAAEQVRMLRRGLASARRASSGSPPPLRPAS